MRAIVFKYICPENASKIYQEFYSNCRNKTIDQLELPSELKRVVNPNVYYRTHN